MSRKSKEQPNEAKDIPIQESLPEDSPAATAAETADPQEATQTTPPEANPSDPEGAAKENWEKYLRLSADFDNYKKRMLRERSDAAKYATTALLESILPVMDNLEMAVQASEKGEDTNLDSLKQGVSMVLQQIKKVLHSSGMVEIDAQGKPFDPNLHEAVSQAESEDVPDGHVMQQLRKGYKLHDRLIRPASVVVAKPPQSGSNHNQENSSTQD